MSNLSCFTGSLSKFRLGKVQFHIFTGLFGVSSVFSLFFQNNQNFFSSISIFFGISLAFSKFIFDCFSNAFSLSSFSFSSFSFCISSFSSSILLSDFSFLKVTLFFSLFGIFIHSQTKVSFISQILAGTWNILFKKFTGEKSKIITSEIRNTKNKHATAIAFHKNWFIKGKIFK